MFFANFHVFRYSRPSSSTIRSALWENTHRSLAALGLLLATAGGALLPTSVLSCSPRWSQEGQHQKTVTNCICKPKQHSWDACRNALCCCFKWFSSRARTCNRFLHTCCFLCDPRNESHKGLWTCCRQNFPHGTKYRPTPDREAFNHKTLRLQIQPARYPKCDPNTMSSH